MQEIYKDRKKFSASVFEVASSDLVNMGLIVVSYTLKDIRDDEGYLKALGMARTAQVCILYHNVSLIVGVLTFSKLYIRDNIDYCKVCH